MSGSGGQQIATFHIGRIDARKAGTSDSTSARRTAGILIVGPIAFCKKKEKKTKWIPKYSDLNPYGAYTCGSYSCSATRMESHQGVTERRETEVGQELRTHRRFGDAVIRKSTQSIFRCGQLSRTVGIFCWFHSLKDQRCGSFVRKQNRRRCIAFIRSAELSPSKITAGLTSSTAKTQRSTFAAFASKTSDSHQSIDLQFDALSRSRTE